MKAKKGENLFQRVLLKDILYFFYSCSSLTEVIPLGKVGFTVKCSELPNQIV